MTLDTERHEPADPNELIRYGMDEAVRLMMDVARAENRKGYGRSLRELQRLVEAAGLVRVKRPHVDDGN